MSRSKSMRFNFCIYIVLIQLIVGANLWAQQKSPVIEPAAYLTQKKFTQYDSVQKYLRTFSRDSVALKRFIKYSKDADYRYGEASAENALGILYRDISKYSEALFHHDNALDIARELDDVELEVSALNMTGVVYRRIDAVRSALDKHNAALELAEGELNPSNNLLKGIAISLNSIGNIYLLLRDYDMAENYFKRAIIKEKELGSDLGLAINFANLGIAFEEREQYKEALVNYRKSLDYNNKINSDLGRVICNNSIAQVYLKQNRPKEALELIQNSMNKVNEIGDQFYIALANINLGWAHSKLQNYSDAEKYLMEGMKLSKEKNFKQFLSMAYMHLSQLNEARSSYKKALEYQRLSQDVQAEYLNEANHKYVSDLNLKYDSEQKRNTISLLEQKNKLAEVKLDQAKKNNIFIIILFSLILLLLFFGYRQYRLKNQKEQLKAEQKLMRSQMNPHFIFNALLSIRIYLQNHNVEEAINYLGQFAQLIRSILSSSLAKENTLQEELETMQLYINIENIRFCNEIETQLEIDDTLNLDQVKIPALILQPFVENALWHGLQAKEGPKKLMIEVNKKNEKYVSITITDNGIGRVKTMDIPKDKRNTQKKSIGIDLTLERLQAFSKNLDNKYKLKIIDLYDTNQQASGTQVRLDLPLS
ncbi:MULTISPECIES: tetratricopeptide repeat protein [unclassified Leeuwenhoekiella]|uniref:tetratricopeptide repeat-containing sensor histidine kinase n=1 Tax=unclassified Leeuwenhoekiella TaxID=2615029 RepID=UPI000C4CE716|nr:MULTISPECIES: tetratricopeptide repeat protein [unclassified Leeuwenhoekiella]MBA81828.1 sensor histidine kinase [Leeuwenhoekiella sp.]